MFGLKSAHLAKRLPREQVPDLIISLNISNGITPRRLADRVLVHHFDLGNAIDITRDRLMKTYFVAKLTFYLSQRGIENLPHERGLTATTHPTDHAEHVQRELHGDIFQ